MVIRHPLIRLWNNRCTQLRKSASGGLRVAYGWRKHWEDDALCEPFERLALCLVAGLLLPRLLLADTITTTNPYVGVTKIDETLSSPRPEAIHILEIDLTAPGIHFEMSPATPPNPPQSGDVTTVQKTLTYMNSVNAQFAINTEFFVNPPHANSATPLWGFAASNGNVYSPFQATNGNTYAIAPNAAAINIDPTNQASVVTRNTSDSSGMTVAQPVTIGNAVSGSPDHHQRPRQHSTYAEAGGVLTDGSGYSSSNSWYANNHLAAAIRHGAQPRQQDALPSYRGQQRQRQ